MSAKAFLDLLKGAFKSWTEDKASRLGAALAYYTIFSIGPLLVVIIAIAGFVFGQSASQGQIVGSIKSVVGDDGARMIQAMVKSASNPTAGIIATVIGGVTLLLGAAGIFGQLKDALNTIWDVKAKAGGGIMSTIKRNFLSFGMLLGTGFLLLVSLVINAALSAVSKFVENTIPGGPLLWQIVNYVVTLGVITLLFAMIYKVLPDADIPWNNVWIGAVATALLFVLGQVVLGIYFSLSNPGSAFGAAGSLVLILVWIYYSAQILFFGAEITDVYSKKHGSPVRPSQHAEWASEEARVAGEALAEKRGKETREQAKSLRSSPWFS